MHNNKSVRFPWLRNESSSIAKQQAKKKQDNNLFDVTWCGDRCSGCLLALFIIHSLQKRGEPHRTA